MQHAIARLNTEPRNGPAIDFQYRRRGKPRRDSTPPCPILTLALAGRIIPTVLQTPYEAEPDKFTRP